MHRYKVKIKWLRGLASVALLAMIIHQMYRHFEGFENGDIKIVQWKYIFLAGSLIFLNWHVEGLKLYYSNDGFKNFSSTHRLKIILSGLTLGIITPARIGEYVGRMYVTPFDQQKISISSTMICSFAQNIINILGGGIVSYFFLKEYIDVTFNGRISFVLWIVFNILLFVVVYFNFEKFWQKGKKYLVRIIPQISIKYLDLALLPNSNDIKWKILLLSGIRYVIYLSQYIFLMYGLGYNVTFLNGVAIIMAIFMIQTLLPIPAILGFVVRVELAILLWSWIGLQAHEAVLLTSVLWLFNLGLPAFMGWWILNKHTQ